MHVYVQIIHMHIYVQIIGKSFQRLLEVFPKNNLASFVTQGITVLGESVIQGFPFIHFN